MRRLIVSIFVVTVCLLWGACLPTYARMESQSASWGYKPLYSTTYQQSAYSGQKSAFSSSYSGTYTPACRGISAFDSKFGEGAKLSSYFKFTPADAMLTNYRGNVLLAGDPTNNPWDEEGDDEGDPTGNPSGEVDDPAPIGEPFILLAMVMLYLFVRKHKRSLKEKSLL